MKSFYWHKNGITPRMHHDHFVISAYIIDDGQDSQCLNETHGSNPWSMRPIGSL